MDEASMIVARETRLILESFARILEAKKDSIKTLPNGDALLVCLTGEALRGMLQVFNNDDRTYLKHLIEAFEDSFIQYKENWIDVLAMNQEKVIQAMAGGMLSE